MRSRLVAWYYTGPLGHLVAGIADWAHLLAAWKLRQRRERRGR